MNTKHLLFLLTGWIIAICPAAPVGAQAYCQLRDPVKQIFRLFPEATTYRSIVRSVDAEAREATREALPFSLHYNELGRHTLYVALRDGQPLGLVHVRSEAGRWGLIEIAWAFDLNLNVRGFVFQRCRDNARREVSAPAIADQIVGKGFGQLRAMLTADGENLAPGGLALPPGSSPAVASLTVTTLRSALKTIVVTAQAWPHDLEEIRWISAGFAAFAGVQTVDKISGVYGAPGLEERLSTAVGADTGLNRGTAVALLVRGDGAGPLGVVLYTDWSAGDQHARVQWVVDLNGTLANVTLDEATSDPDLAAAFDALRGRTRDSFNHCATPIELAAKEALEVAAASLEAIASSALSNAH